MSKRRMDKFPVEADASSTGAKRSRKGDSKDLLSTKGAFTFAFNFDTAAAEVEDSALAPKPNTPPSPPQLPQDLPFSPTPVCCIVTSKSSLGLRDLALGDFVDIDYSRSSTLSLSAIRCVHCLSGDESKRVLESLKTKSRRYTLHPSFVRPLLPFTGDSKGKEIESLVWEYDSVFGGGGDGKSGVSNLMGTPIFEPGLDSYSWPLGSERFRREVFDKKAFVVHGCGTRLNVLKQDFNHFDVKSMLDEASKVVVWMKDRRGKMQYIQATPEVGWSCFNSGHSLYFNPSIKVQEKWMRAICMELGLNFGMLLDTGGSTFGGDLEVFAVQGPHVTPWHFDAQHNFTIQLSGFKSWKVARSGIANPMTNLHPSSTNMGALMENIKLHRTYTSSSLDPPVYTNLENSAKNAKDFSQFHSFVLRPGSVAYVPAGWWHTVQSFDPNVSPSVDSSISVSINMSVDAGRWADLLMSRLKGLVARDARWRQRIQVSSLPSAQTHLGLLLSSLKSSLEALTPSHFLPPAMLLEHRTRVIHLGGSHGNARHQRELYEQEVGEIRDTSKFERNPLGSIAVISRGEKVEVIVSHGNTRGGTADFEVTIVAPKILRPSFDSVVHLKTGTCLNLLELGVEDRELGKTLLGTLAFNGLLLPSAQAEVSN
ncbi:hypothetical protein AAMO2058_000748100 [Amorphochlora amoebiformis]